MGDGNGGTIIIFLSKKNYMVFVNSLKTKDDNVEELWRLVILCPYLPLEICTHHRSITHSDIENLTCHHSPYPLGVFIDQIGSILRSTKPLYSFVFALISFKFSNQIGHKSKI